MKGRHTIVARRNKVQFTIDVERNLTVIRGKSATGKSTLVEMVADYESDGIESGVELKCDVPCAVIEGNRWKQQLSLIENSIVFVDEGSRFMHTPEFASAAKRSSNYYVLVTRRDMPTLPYSVDAVLELYATTRRSLGNGDQRFYSKARPLYTTVSRHLYEDLGRQFGKPDVVVVEDSHAGFQFYSALCKRAGIACVSAGGVGNVRSTVLKADAKNVLVIADGAAFGPYVAKLLDTSAYKNVQLFLPESFEWVLLGSGLVPDKDIPEILQHPYDYIESRRYFSWEAFFTDLLEKRTVRSKLAYSKDHLNERYLSDKVVEEVTGLLPSGLL